MGSYPLSLVIISISILSGSVPISYSIDEPDKSLSYTEKRCDNEYCTVTTCFEDKQCSITDQNDSPTETTTSNDRTHQLSGDFDSNSNSENLEIMNMLDELFDLNQHPNYYFDKPNLIEPQDN
jgi:hypothetical protein